MSVEEQGISLFKIKPGLVAKGYGIRSASQVMDPKFIRLAKSYFDLIN